METMGGTRRSRRQARLAHKLARRCRKLSLVACTISANWRESGRARLLVVREGKDRRMVVARFVVDLWCMGLLSAELCADVGMSALSALRAETYGEAAPMACPPELAATIVYGGIEYAARLGFSPDPAWDIAQHALPEPPPAEARPPVAFGRDGKPCYVAGAGDDERVLARLDQRLGPDDYHVLLPD